MSKILELHRAGLSQRQIAKKLGIGKTTVARAIQKSQVSFDVDQLARAYDLVIRYESANLSSVVFTFQDRRVTTPKPDASHFEHLANVVLPILFNQECL
jgi:transcriptional regulator with XRE-family HTH domain